jgi:hypothetical protein
VEARRAESNPKPDSMDLYFQGAAVYHKGQTFENLISARTFFERAVALDSNNVEALVGIALVDWSIGGAAMDSDPRARYSSAEAAVTTALSLAPDHIMAHRVFRRESMYRPNVNFRRSQNANVLSRWIGTPQYMLP